MMKAHIATKPLVKLESTVRFMLAIPLCDFQHRMLRALKLHENLSTVSWQRRFKNKKFEMKELVTPPTIVMCKRTQYTHKS